jgi:hypothetical protein
VSWCEGVPPSCLCVISRRRKKREKQQNVDPRDFFSSRQEGRAKNKKEAGKSQRTTKSTTNKTREKDKAIPILFNSCFFLLLSIFLCVCACRV